MPSRLSCIDWFYRCRRQRAVIAGGLLTGLAFLTKPEIFLGCAATWFLGLVAANRLTGSKRIAPILATAIAAMLLPPLAAFCFFAFQMPIHTALGGVLSGWQFLNQPYVISTPFYKGSLGADEPLSNCLRMFECAARVCDGCNFPMPFGPYRQKLAGTRTMDNLGRRAGTSGGRLFLRHSCRRSFRFFLA